MSLLPCLLVLFLSIHGPASLGAPAPLPPTYDGSMCAREPVLCGGVAIHYPFYLSNATRETPDHASYSCGYADLNISCQSNGRTWTPTIRLGGHSYTVQSIFYNNQSFILVDTDLLSGGGCPLVSHNVTFDETWLHNTSSNNLSFFYGCFSRNNAPPGFDAEKYRIQCPGFNSPFGGVYSFMFAPQELNRSMEDDLAAGRCNQTVSVPVRSESLMGSDPAVLRRDGYGDVLQKGFELGWSRKKTDQCYMCELSTGKCAYSGKDLVGCLCDGGKVDSQECKNSGARNASPPSHDGNKRTKMYIIVSTSCFLFLCLLMLVLLWTWKYGLLPFKPKDEPWIVSFLQKNENLHPKRYTYAEVKRMTKSFSTKLGQGGFGTVYRGNLSNGCQVAVKMLKDSKGDGEQFMNEVASISRTSHVNVVTLLGFCLQGSKRALIYEYMANGSLERYAFGSNTNRENTLSWNELFNIAIGIARGLEYLHRGCNTRIVHFDIKPHNILLDQDFCPKISDFGLAKLCLNKESAISIGGARGTIGYIAPEVYSKQFGTISSKSDVYSYGMMVLEMVGARDKNINANTESSSQYFPQWIYEHLDDYCISASEINGETTEIVRKMIVVGLWCIQMIPTDRPTMTRVVEMLEGSTSNLELPPKALLSL